MTAILVKVIKPFHFNSRAIVDEMVKQIKKEGDMMRKELQKTTRTWQHIVPFIKQVKTHGRELSVHTRPDMRHNAGKVWHYLDKGTKERWAVMSDPFTPKTRVGHLGSSRGTGRAIIRGRRAMQRRSIPARPGITAREWSKAVVKMRRRVFHRNMQRAVDRGAKRVF